MNFSGCCKTFRIAKTARNTRSRVDQKIGGDTSSLEKSLSDVNNAIKKTQIQLRDVAF